MNNLNLGQNQTSNYYKEHGIEWAEAHDVEEFWTKLFSRFYELLPEGSSMLEIGFGGLRDGRQFIEHGYRYTGIDASETFVKYAEESGLSGEFHQMRAQDINFEDQFEGFAAIASLLHIPKAEIDLVLNNINRALKEDGLGMITLKKLVDDGPDERIETDQFGERFFAYWTFDEFKSILEKHGFVIEYFEEEQASPRTTWLKFIVRKVSEN